MKEGSEGKKNQITTHMFASKGGVSKKEQDLDEDSYLRHIKDFTQLNDHLTNVLPLPTLQKSLFFDPLVKAARKIAFSSEDVRIQMDKLRGIETDIERAALNKPKNKIELSFGALTPEQNKIVFSKSILS